MSHSTLNRNFYENLNLPSDKIFKLPAEYDNDDIIQKIFEALDRNKNDAIDFDEFVVIISALKIFI